MQRREPQYAACSTQIFFHAVWFVRQSVTCSETQGPVSRLVCVLKKMNTHMNADHVCVCVSS